MSPTTILFSICLLSILFTWIMYIIFGQITVKKLRKNEATKDHLGLNLISGWDIFNAAQAISLPKSITKRFEKSRLSFLEAKSRLIKQHINTTDVILANIFFWSWALSAVLIFSVLIQHIFLELP